jgi:hypothetical protein
MLALARLPISTQAQGLFTFMQFFLGAGRLITTYAGASLEENT